jgi:hypothetical protein
MTRSRPGRAARPCQAAYRAQDGPQSINTRLRAAWVEGAEEDSLRRLGRGLTPEELEGVMRRYPGDV